MGAISVESLHRDRHSAVYIINMFKLLVLSCLLVSCLADPSDLPPRFREAGHQQRYHQGCANRVEGWLACARLNSSDSLAPHGRDCSLFFYCTEGARPVCRQCSAGLYFNPQLQVCDWPENVNCVPRPHHNGTTPYPTTHTTSGDDATITVIDVSTTSSTASPTTEPSVFSWGNYIPWSRK